MVIRQPTVNNEDEKEYIFQQIPYTRRAGIQFHEITKDYYVTPRAVKQEKVFLLHRSAMLHIIRRSTPFSDKPAWLDHILPSQPQ